MKKSWGVRRLETQSCISQLHRLRAGFKNLSLNFQVCHLGPSLRLVGMNSYLWLKWIDWGVSLALPFFPIHLSLYFLLPCLVSLSPLPCLDLLVTP